MTQGGHRSTQHGAIQPGAAQRRTLAAAAARAISGAFTCLLLAAVMIGWGASSAFALKAIPVGPDQERIDVTPLGEYYEGRGDNLQLETAASADGLAGRMAVRAVTAGTNPNWMVFALTNTSDKPLERWLTAERYTVIGSGVIWPDLDARRMENVTPSIGFIPERIKSDRADIFRLSLDPGQTITYVVELSSERLARLYLWKSIDYELKARDRQLFNGILLGLLGLLAIFLTAIFAANHKAIFPTAALVAWCVLGYLCVDFGFFHKLFQLRPEGNAVYRAATESAMAASLVIFLHTYLRLGVWHGFIRMLVAAWIVAQLALVAVAVIDPRLASTFARLSFVLIGGAGMLFTLFLALRGQDRALALVPTWLLLLVWIFAAAVVLTGRLTGDVVISGLVAGLVLIIVLLGFTVTQFAFRTLEPIHGVAPSELQLRSLAVDGSHAALWQWNARRDELKISPHVEASLGLAAGALSTSVDDFIRHMHQADRERFRLTLWSLQERGGGNLHVEFRLRHADNSFRWFEVEAASAPNSERRTLRCIGLMRDITDARRAQERLLHDAVNDSLTGLPNRELFLDRLSLAVVRAAKDPASQPTVMFIDLDRFRSVNTDRGLVVGDSLLLTIARRLQRHLSPEDTLARVGGDQFAILLLGQNDARALAQLAERVRRSLRSPINITGEEIVITGAVGLAVFDGEPRPPSELLKDAELAMHRAKRQGADRIEIFRPEMRSDRRDEIDAEADLLRAIERSQVRLLYQPIIYLPTGDLAGFEVLVRWEHPRLGVIDPASIITEDDPQGLTVRLGSLVLTRAAQEVARWHKELPRADRPLFVDVKISSGRMFRQDLIQEIRHILGRAVAPQNALKLSIAESLVLENPEQASEILEWLRGAGADLILNEFGCGYTSLAYLQRFPFDSIRIDPVLVHMSTPEGQGSPLVRGIAALAHELGRKVIADGVETHEDASFLRSLGCEYAQGSLYGEPMTERGVLDELKALRKADRKLQRAGLFRMKRRPLPAPERGPAEAPVAAAPVPDATQQRPRTPRAAHLAKGMTVRSRGGGSADGDALDHEHSAPVRSGQSSRSDLPPRVQAPPPAAMPAMPHLPQATLPPGAPMPPPHALAAPRHAGAPTATHDFLPNAAADSIAAMAAAAPQVGELAEDSAWSNPAGHPAAPDLSQRSMPYDDDAHDATYANDDSAEPAGGFAAPHAFSAHPSLPTTLTDALSRASGPPEDQAPRQPHYGGDETSPDEAPAGYASDADPADLDPADAGTAQGGPTSVEPTPDLEAAPEDAAALSFSAVLPPAPHAARPEEAQDVPITADGSPPVVPATAGAPDEPTRPTAPRRAPVTDLPELKTLPPAIAASLARLAGVPIGDRPAQKPPARKPPLAGE